MTLRVSPLASPRKIKQQIARNAAQRTLQTAVASGKVKKPTRCQRCRKPIEKKKLQSHHRDHEKPFDVKWFCALCHSKAHGKKRHQTNLFYKVLRESGVIGH